VEAFTIFSALKGGFSMTRALAWFLLLFWILGLSVHLTGMIHLFMLVAVVALGCDLLSKSYPGTNPRPGAEDDPH
jgi:queuine/archaeosine tRNA-ribosyltransferase